MSTPSFRTGADKADIRRSTRKQRNYIYDLIDDCEFDDVEVDPRLADLTPAMESAREKGLELEQCIERLSLDEAHDLISELQHYAHVHCR